MNNQNLGRPVDYQITDTKSPIPTHIGGVALCLFCTALTFVGTRTVVNGLTRDANNKIAQAQIQVTEDVESSKDTTSDIIVSDDDKTNVAAETIVTYDYTNDQLNWAHQYHITWDENGNPIDEKGNIVDDPTTDVNEVARAIADGTANKDGMSVAYLNAHGEKTSTDDNQNITESVVESPYEGKDNVSRLSDGTYVYTVQAGDTLSKIAEKFGTTVDELVKLNDIDNPSLIHSGQQIKLPSVTVSDNGSGAGLG